MPRGSRLDISSLELHVLWRRISPRSQFAPRPVPARCESCRPSARERKLAALQGAMCALVLGSAAALFTPAGIAGAGWAVLLSMTLLFGSSAVYLWRSEPRKPRARRATRTVPSYGSGQAIE